MPVRPFCHIGLDYYTTTITPLSSLSFCYYHYNYQVITILIVITHFSALFVLARMKNNYRNSGVITWLLVAPITNLTDIESFSLVKI